MRPDIVTIGNVSTEWVRAIERDIASGIVPPWIGAIVVNECQGQVSMALVERWKWVLRRTDLKIAKN